MNWSSAILIHLDPHVKVQHRLVEMWKKEPENRDALERAWERARQLHAQRKADGQRSSPSDMYSRNLLSFHKSELFWRFGGKLWWRLLMAAGRVTLLIAAGRVTQSMVVVVNDVLEVIVQEKAQRAATAFPIVYLQGHGRRKMDAPMSGIQHMKVRPKRPREQAQLDKKSAEKHDKA